MTVLAVIVAIALLVPAFDLLARPIIRRQAVRNLTRRPGETAIVIGGALLGTAIITASFVVGDTIRGSIRDIAQNQLGPIDEVVQVDDPAALDATLARLDAAEIANTDGLLRSVRTSAAVADVPADGGDVAAIPDVLTLSVDLDDARAFGDDADATGLALVGSNPGIGEVVVNDNVARTLDLSVGDDVDVHLYGDRHRLQVIAIAPAVGLAGLGSDTIVVGPGTIETWWGSATAASAAPPQAEILVSNVGGVYDGAAQSDDVVADLHAALTGVSGVEISAWKADVLADADSEGSELTTIFSSIGAFAVIAGILLVVNIVVMLTDERRSQLGVLRALGSRRGHVVRMMGLEGTGYAVVAAAAGAVAGVGVGWVVTQFARSIVEADGLELRFALQPDSLLVGGAIGLLVTLVTVWATSIRLARMNVIAAVRDLPQPRSRRRRVWSVVLGALATLAGAAVAATGISSDDPVGALAGPALVAFAAIPVLRPVLGARLAPTLGGLAAIAWGIAVFVLAPDTMADPEISVFVFQGVILVAGAVLVSTANSAIWRRLPGLLGSGRRSVPVRLGLTHPLSRPGRTGLVLGMYSLVIFTITFMALITAVFEAQSDEIAADAGVGYDILVDSNPSNPPTTEQLLAVDGVDGVAAVSRSFVDMTWASTTDTLPLSGIDADLLAFGGPELAEWDPAYDGAADAMAAVVAGDPVTVIGEFMFGDDAGEANPVIGDTITVSGSGRSLDLTVIGITDSDWLFNGALVSRSIVAEVDDGVAARHFLGITDGVDTEATAAALNGQLLAHGADARTFVAEVDEEISGQSAFIRILQGYLGLGLAIGVAGLAIVLVRAVRERRREIGMLRAMGYSATAVRRSFLVEALFIAGQGALLGVGLGTVTAWQVVTEADVFGVGSPTLVIPVVALVVIGVGPIVASLAAAAWPAARAARIRPAVALRVTG